MWHPLHTKMKMETLHIFFQPHWDCDTYRIFFNMKTTSNIFSLSNSLLLLVNQPMVVGTTLLQINMINSHIVEDIVLNSMVEQIIFGNILRVYGTPHNHLPPHGSPVYDLNQIHEVLLGLEAAYELSVIW